MMSILCLSLFRGLAVTQFRQDFWTAIDKMKCIFFNFKVETWLRPISSICLILDVISINTETGIRSCSYLTENSRAADHDDSI